MTTLLAALLANESGGRNIANTQQGTSSGQAQGFFQITTGTWKDFGGTQFAANPLGATYAQQAAIASLIPLKRWDSSTLAAMRATGIPIDPNQTLGQNLSAAGEGFGSNPTASDTSMLAGASGAAPSGGGIVSTADPLSSGSIPAAIDKQTASAAADTTKQNQVNTTNTVKDTSTAAAVASSWQGTATNLFQRFGIVGLGVVFVLGGILLFPKATEKVLGIKKGLAA